MSRINATYKLKYKRRRLNKTNYDKRLRLVVSGKDRVIIRISNSYVICQFVRFVSKGWDETLLSVTSKFLSKHGWNYGFSNMPAAYLTGLLAGINARKKNVSEVILDAGLFKPVSKGRIYACLKGIVDAGIKVPHNPKVFPSEERISGKHISDYALKLKNEDANLYNKRFSSIIKKNALPENIVDVFSKVKAKVMSL